MVAIFTKSNTFLPKNLHISEKSATFVPRMFRLDRRSTDSQPTVKANVKPLSSLCLTKD